jgi:hypothetical protein
MADPAFNEIQADLIPRGQLIASRDRIRESGDDHEPDSMFSSSPRRIACLQNGRMLTAGILAHMLLFLTPDGARRSVAASSRTGAVLTDRPPSPLD